MLLSGSTRIIISQIDDLFQGPGVFRAIVNPGAQVFRYVISDQNGNPITADSTVTVSFTNAAAVDTVEFVGARGFTIPDAQRGNTVFEFTLRNVNPLTSTESTTITIDVDSAENGDASASVARALLGVVTINGDISTPLPGLGGTTASFSITGGSEMVYTVSTTVGMVR